MLAGGVALPTAVSAAPNSYVACNQYDECWRVHERYSYPSEQKIVIHDGDWYDSHHGDAQLHWVSDPEDGRGWYEHGAWHSDPGLRAVKVGAAGAGVGAAIGCVVTILVGCVPGAAAGAAIGGGAGAVAGAATAH